MDGFDSSGGIGIFPEDYFVLPHILGMPIIGKSAFETMETSFEVHIL